MEEVEGKSKWYRMVKGEVGLEEYRSGGSGRGKTSVSGSAGLFEGKKQWKMCADDRCMLCNSGETGCETRCEEFKWEKQQLLQKIGRMEGTHGWMSMEGWRMRERWHYC